MEKNHEKLSNLLQSYVKTRLEKKSRLSKNSISEQLGIEASTFNRILNGRTQPGLKSLIKLSKAIPEIKDFLPKELFSVVLEKTDGEMLGEKLERLLSDPDMFLIYALACSDVGITENFIIKNFGSKKISKLKILEKEGFIKKESNGIEVYKMTENRQITASFELIKRHIRILNQFYKPDEPESNYAFYGIERLNRKGVLKLMQATKEFHKKTIDIINEKENMGNIPVFSTGVSDIFLNE